MSMTDEEAARHVIRRSASPGLAAQLAELPRLGVPRWLAVPTDQATLDAIMALPPPVPAAGGSPAHALLILGLIRAWSSSEAALRAMLRRRLERAAVLAAALESGRLPGRKEVNTWPVMDAAIQLGFQELLAGGDEAPDAPAMRESVEWHIGGTRAIMRCLDKNAGRADAARAAWIAEVRSRHPGVPLVAFTQFTHSATAAFDASNSSGGVALVTGRGARIASGRVTALDVTRRFDVAESPSAPARALPMHVLIATDVLSEGLSLRRAGVLLHLDLPWTVARLEQRVGRLRRFGSSHRIIEVYAIGPPVEARELVAVIRALQRKARVAAPLAGADSMLSAVPLVGPRLHNALISLPRRGETQAMEQLRLLLTEWSLGHVGRVEGARDAQPREPVALARLCLNGTPRVVAIVSGKCTTSTSALSQAASAIAHLSSSGERGTAASADSVSAALAAIGSWMGSERARFMSRDVSEASSPGHCAVLRSLAALVRTADRLERGAVATRVERLRSMVLAARGIGAERALESLAREAVGELDPVALERLLAIHAPRVASAIQPAADSTTVLLVAEPARSALSAYEVSLQPFTC